MRQFSDFGPTSGSCPMTVKHEKVQKVTLIVATNTFKQLCLVEKVIILSLIRHGILQHFFSSLDSRYRHKMHSEKCPQVYGSTSLAMVAITNQNHSNAQCTSYRKSTQIPNSKFKFFLKKQKIVLIYEQISLNPLIFFCRRSSKLFVRV
jgi:hypothetical protein